MKKYAKHQMPWGPMYVLVEDSDDMDRNVIHEIIAERKYGKGWDELYEFQQEGIVEIWNISDRPKLEKYLWRIK